MRPLTIGPTAQLHLQHPEIDPELQFMPAIQPKYFAYFDGTVFMGPVFQNGVQVEAHPEKMIEHLVFNCQSPRAFCEAVSSEHRQFRRGTNVGSETHLLWGQPCRQQRSQSLNAGDARRYSYARSTETVSPDIAVPQDPLF